MSSNLSRSIKDPMDDLFYRNTIRSHATGNSISLKLALVLEENSIKLSDKFSKGFNRRYD
jgi:hypothetical protein